MIRSLLLPLVLNELSFIPTNLRNFNFHLYEIIIQLPHPHFLKVYHFLIIWYQKCAVNKGFENFHGHRFFLQKNQWHYMCFLYNLNLIYQLFESVNQNRYVFEHQNLVRLLPYLLKEHVHEYQKIHEKCLKRI